MKYKDQYIELIVKQKTAALNRCQQQTSKFAITYEDGEQMLR